MSSKDKPSFNIIESSYEDYDDIYEDFKNDYMSCAITVKKMQEKYDITPNQYRRLKNRVMEETGVNRKLSRNTTGSMWVHCDKYIEGHKSSNRYKVSKVINGKKFFFGVYDSLEEAKFIRDRLEEENWSIDAYERLRYELFGEEPNHNKIEKIYDDFKVDFMRGESMKYLRKKYSLGSDAYRTLSKMIRCEEGLIRKPQLNYKVARKNERDLYRQMQM